MPRLNLHVDLDQSDEKKIIRTFFMGVAFPLLDEKMSLKKYYRARSLIFTYIFLHTKKHRGKSNEFVDFVDAGKLPLKVRFYGRRIPLSLDKRTPSKQFQCSFFICFVSITFLHTLPLKVIPLLSGVGVRVLWSKSIDDIDFLFFAPLFLKGLRISEDPYRTIAEEGLFQLLESGDDRIIGVVSHLVQGMVSNINTRERMCCIATVRVLQELIVSHPEAVERISEHFKSLLPALDFLNRKASWGTRIRNLVQEAIEMMDILGSEESRLKIRCVLPSYKGLVWDNAE